MSHTNSIANLHMMVIMCSMVIFNVNRKFTILGTLCFGPLKFEIRGVIPIKPVSRAYTERVRRIIKMLATRYYFAEKRHTANSDATLYIHDTIIPEMPIHRVNKSKNEGNVFLPIYSFYQSNYGISFVTSEPQVQFAIANIVQSTLYKKGGFLLHASSAIYRNHALLFSGDSGIGKSTIISLFNKIHFRSFTDEHVIVLPKNKVFYASQTRMYEPKHIRSTTKSYKIASLFFLKQAQDNKITPLLSKQIFFYKLLEQWRMSKTPETSIQAIASFVARFKNRYLLFFSHEREKFHEVEKLVISTTTISS